MSKFWRLNKAPNEKPTMFSVRLLQAFKTAHPQFEFDFTNNESLIEKFIDSQDEDMRNHIKESTLIHTSTGLQLPYKTYVNLAERYELEIKPRQQRVEKMQPTQQPKYYPNQFKNVNQNKGFQTIDVSVPPPNYNGNTQVNTDRPLVDISQPDYAGVMTTGTNGPVPNQSRPKDNPPVKNTPPGVPIHNSHRPKNFNKQPKLDNPQVKYVQYPPKLNSYENHKIRIFTNKPNLRTKVLNHYTSDNPKNNFVICPHSTVQSNRECYYCQNSHPELLKLEKSIASFNSSFVANNSLNNNTQQNLNPLPTDNQFE
ncbi:unnamed protein product, partial [Rotaria magnacalcarata]